MTPIEVLKKNGLFNEKTIKKELEKRQAGVGNICHECILYRITGFGCTECCDYIGLFSNRSCENFLNELLKLIKKENNIFMEI